jgi:hypothetical protein
MRTTGSPSPADANTAGNPRPEWTFAPDSSIVRSTTARSRSNVGTAGSDETPDQSISWKTISPPGAARGHCREQRRGVGLELQHVPPDHGVERLAQVDRVDGAHMELHVAEPALGHLRPGGGDAGL